MGSDFTFFCYACDAHVAIADTVALADLDGILEPIGWKLVSIDSGDGPRAWACPECQRCPYCEQLHDTIPSKMMFGAEELDIAPFTPADKKLLN